MNSGSISKEVEIKAPASEVWKAITQKESLKEWFFEVDDFQPVAGFEFKFTGKNEEGSFPVTCRIIQISENKFLSISWSYDDYPAETIVTFELSGTNKTSHLKLSHEGLEKIPGNKKGLGKEDHERGWKMLLDVSLKNYAEKSWAAWQKFE